MGKNMTLSIPDEISERMEELSEVNWSAVARNAFEEYLDIRKDPEISGIIERLTKEKNDQYARGFAAASKIAKKLSFEKFIDIFSVCDERIAEHYEILNPPLSSTDILKSTTALGFGISTSSQEPIDVDEDTQKSILVDVFEDKKLLTNAGTSKEYERGFYEAMMKFRDAIGE